MEESQGFNLYDQWRFFLRLLAARRWTILTFLSITFLVVVIGTSLQTPIYVSTATVLIDTELPSVLTVSTSRDDTTLGQSNYFTYADYYRTQLEVIKSRRIARKVFENLKLGSDERYTKQKDPIGSLLDQLSVDPVKQTRLVKIRISDADPRQAARIANEFAFVFVAENLTKAAANESLTLMKNEYVKLQSKQAELSKRYKAKFPAMVRVREQMTQISTAIEKELARQMGEEHTENTLPQGPSSDDRLTAGTLLRELQGNSMMGGLRPNNIRVQDMAQVPLKRSKPRVGLNLFLGLLLGILGGIAAAVIEELLDSTIKVPKDLERDKRFTSLGHVPRITFPVEPGQIPPPLDPHQICRHMHLKTNSEAAEGYRVIRTNLIYAAPENDARTLLFTSPGSGEGKSTTVCNLGIAFSQLGLKVLIIDADLRNPSIHTGFGIPQSPGLSEYLVGRNSFQEVVHHVGILDLCIVPGGALPPNPAELLSLPKMRDFLKEAEQKFDRVILDTPPIVPVTDATLLAAFVKSIVAVAQSGTTPWQALEQLYSNCQSVRGKLLGVILNNVTGYDVPSYGYGRQLYPYGPGASARPKGFRAEMLESVKRFFKPAVKGRSKGGVAKPSSQGPAKQSPEGAGKVV